MADNALATAPADIHWNGGVSPFGVSWQKLMMWFFIVSDSLLFAGFIGTYGFVRLSHPEAWPVIAEVFHLEFITLMTFTLISSSLTMAVAVSAARHGDRARVAKFLLLTVVGGALFLGMQAFEWSEVLGQGWTVSTSPDLALTPSFGSCFFVITGFHGTHVLIGVVILLITLRRFKAGKTPAEKVELAGLYWHFVDLVWVFLFTLFYLI